MKMDAHHPLAESAAKRLHLKAPESPAQDLHLGDSDSGIDLSPGLVCPNCGAQNSDEFERCWQCHAQLSRAISTPKPEAVTHEPGEPLLRPETIALTAGVVVVTLLLLGAFLSIKLMLSAGAVPLPTRSLWDLYTQELGITRILTGVLVILAWPVALRLAVSLVKQEEEVAPPALVTLTGLLLGALAYVGTWLPPHLLVLAPLLPMALSLTVIAGVFRLGLARGLSVWALQFLVVLVVAVVGFFAIEAMRLGQFFNPLSEIPAVAHYVREQGGVEVPGSHTIPGKQAPIQQRIQWHSTGAPWLDACAGEAVFTVYTQSEEAGLKFEIQDHTGTVVFEPVQGRQWSTAFRVKAGFAYTLVVSGPPEATATVKTAGLLVPAFID